MLKVAKIGNHKRGMLSFLPSLIIKTTNTSADTITSSQKNAPIRVENSSSINKEVFKPLVNTQGIN